MKLVIVAALVVVALASEKPYYPKPAYPAPAYPPAYGKSYDYAPIPYSFDWAVLDQPSYNDFGQKETSDGKIVSGTYYVALPDGRRQTVTYKADDYGYVADVEYDGEAKYPAYKSAYPAYPKPAYPAPAYPKPSYPEPAYQKPTYAPPAYPKTSNSKPSYPSYPKPSYPAYRRPEYPSYRRPTYPSYPKPSYPFPSTTEVSTEALALTVKGAEMAVEATTEEAATAVTEAAVAQSLSEPETSTDTA